MSSKPQYFQPSQPPYTQVPQGDPVTWATPSPSLTHSPVPSYRRYSTKAPILASILAFLITLTLIVLVFANPKFFKTGQYSLLKANIYTFSLVIFATLLASFVRTQLQVLWIREVDRVLAEQGGAAGWDVLNKRWRTALGIARLHERWGSSTNIKISLTYITTGLLISCITAGFSIYQEPRTVQYHPQIPDGRDYACANVTAEKFPTSWKIDGGKYYTAHTNYVLCPTSEAEILFGNVNNQDPSAFAYADMGVAVLSSALGAPASIYGWGWVPGRDDAIISLSTKYQLGLLQTTQCVPVMQRNPFSCRKGGSIQFSTTNNTMYATSADGGCKAWDDFRLNNIDPRETNAMVKEYCTGSTLGQGTIVIGASRAFAPSLAKMIHDPFGLSEDSSDNFVVTCTVNVNAQTFAYRKVYFEYQYNSGNPSVPFSKILFGNDEPCNGPAGYPAGSNAQIALAAISSRSIMMDNIGMSGWSQVLAAGTLDANFSPRQPENWAFRESQNPLEDFLGVTAAIVVSRMFDQKEAMIATDGSARVLSWRIGSGSRVALLYAIPPFVVFLSLIWRLNSLKRVGVRWKTSRLGDLISYGRAMSDA